MAGVRLKGVTKRYGDVVAVDHVDLDIQDGEFIILLGPSGCGKSTLLNSVAGLEDITGGEIYIGDRQVNRVPPKARNVAMVFQDYALYPHMNVYNNMAFGLKLRKTPKSEIEERVRRAAQLLNIEQLLDRRPRQLSGGQRQRVALGRAIVREPDVFLMDEPLSNLDAILRVQMRAEISKLHRRLQTTVLYVTHDQVEAMTMGDRIVILKDGVIQQIGTPQEVYEQPSNMYVAGFIGTPSMNFLTGTVTSERGHPVFKGAHVSIPVPRTTGTALERGPAVVGIRPSAMTVLSRDEDQSANEGTAVFAGRVEVVEPMGDLAYVFVDVGGDMLTVRVSPSHLPRVGDAIPIRVESSALHVFDAGTQQTILNATPDRMEDSESVKAART